MAPLYLRAGWVAGEHTSALTKRNNKTRTHQQAKHQGKPIIAMQRVFNSLRFFSKSFWLFIIIKGAYRC